MCATHPDGRGLIHHDMNDAISLYCTSHPHIFTHDCVAIAVAVSGGADSMALAHALISYCHNHHSHIQIHILTVDHGLRPDAKNEAAHVAHFFNGMDADHITHNILTWVHDGRPKTRIQEDARTARYDLMAQYMHDNDIMHLFLGHHQDDQAETFLFRLAKGSGLDGLACMRPMQYRADNIVCCRPFLDVPKAHILDYCRAHKIDYIHDPSNDDARYARVKLRQAHDILAEEGLTAARLSVTAKRLSRAHNAIDHIVEKIYYSNALEIETNRIVFKFNDVRNQPDEIILRLILRAMHSLSPKEGYGVRLHRVEALCEDLCHAQSFRRRTLGGVIFERDDTKGLVILLPEKI